MVHEHWKPSSTLRGVLHALCRAHHLRELKAPIELEKERWAARLYDALVAAGLAFHEAPPPLLAKTAGSGKRRARQRRRTGHNLLLRLQTRRDDVRRFLTDPRVPFTHNLAEQAARMMQLRQKSSGGFRSEPSAGECAVIRALIATAKKQGGNVLDPLTQSPDTLLTKLRVA